MGSPISPLFADIVMDDLETDCLKILKENDDIIPLFLSIKNTQYRNKYVQF